MRFSKHKIKGFILCLSLSLPFTFANATNSIFSDNLLEFSLTLNSQNTHFNFTSVNYKTKLEQLGVNWYEPFTQYFHGGLEFGYFDMSQINNPLPSAKFTSGEYAGLLLRFLPINNAHLSLTLNLNYRYNRSNGESTSQKTEFSWHESSFVTEIQYQPVKEFNIVLGAEYRLLNGEQRDSGNITQIAHFNEDKQQGYRLGLNFMPNRTGIIGLYWLSGSRNGGGLSFTRKF